MHQKVVVLVISAALMSALIAVMALLGLTGLVEKLARAGCSDP
jgi:hypothetical protein